VFDPAYGNTMYARAPVTIRMASAVGWRPAQICG
jgi:hypothetical protein